MADNAAWLGSSAFALHFFLVIQSRCEIQAANQGERDIAADGVVGGNAFNALGCTGFASLVSAQTGLLVPPVAIHFDLWAMIAVAFACDCTLESAGVLGYDAACVTYRV